ncbi:TRAP transporter substrate-binding protein [Amphritea sp. 1_MG-2023]|uniref:TRAP transporter substrate-binding protein n=1 Tax=Amphritea sp. 1_MG-2023 TaxID=3062670 RepID=UPI0026E4409F|nr:TRAP transporter substrate-binding protein [Amphritea sp. 1_MG-2023]MDO6565164.1 TRAP transporter substrate-binding protein [Amphritea sp. 1_MG-2023]
MTKKIQDQAITSIERRNFFNTMGKAGFTAAVVAGAAGALVSTEAAAAVSKEEAERKKAAKYTMTIATAYVLGATRSYPIMQLDFKENIQNLTDGQVYVKLAPAGQLGAGGHLIQKVQQGTIQAAQHSLSNLSAFAPVVDLINIPFWCGENQKFINLVHSQAWKDQVDPKLEARGFKALWYVCIDSRTVAMRSGRDEIVHTPDDLKGVKFRVAGSQILQQFYRLLGANPTPIAWGETPSAIKQGVADALDPSIGALNIFGFKDVLSSVSFIQAVPDAQVFSCNLKWFNSLPEDIQKSIELASEITSHQNIAKVPSARAYAMYELKKNGVKFYYPTEDELAQWVAKAGHQLPVWDKTKIELAGSLEVFEELLQAANTPGRYYVKNV